MSRHPWRNLKNPRGNPEDFFMHCLCEREKKMSLRAKRSNPGSERWLMDCHGFLNENLAMTVQIFLGDFKGLAP